MAYWMEIPAKHRAARTKDWHVWALPSLISQKHAVTEELDRYDRHILEILQEDATISMARLAERVGLTASPCWRRVQRLQEKRVIRKQVSLLDPAHLGLGVTVFILVRTNQHRMDWFQSFYELVTAMPEVVEFYRVTGSTDYLIKAVVPDIQGYDRIYKALIKGAEMVDVSSMFAMEQIKYTTAFPVFTH